MTFCCAGYTSSLVSVEQHSSGCHRSCLVGHSRDKGRLSVKLQMLFGVRQGSVPGYLLFLLYTTELFDVITEFGCTGHSYADDTQVYVSTPATDRSDATDRLTRIRD